MLDQGRSFQEFLAASSAADVLRCDMHLLGLAGAGRAPPLDAPLPAAYGDPDRIRLKNPRCRLHNRCVSHSRFCAYEARHRPQSPGRRLYSNHGLRRRRLCAVSTDPRI
jgi:hypothetical protein